MSAQAPTPGEQVENATPIPPRYRWLKRIGIAAGLFVIAFVVLLIWWRGYADRKLQAAIDRIKATGEPLFPEDFNTPPIPDSQNAAALYQRAANLIDPDRDADHSVTDSCFARAAASDAFITTCGSLMSTHAEAIALAREARKLPNVRWSVEFRSPLMSLLLPNLRGARTLSKLLRVKTKIDHLHHQDVEVVRSIEDILALGAAVDQQPTLVSHLVAISIEAQALRVVEDWAAELVIGDRTGRDSANAAHRESVKRLIKRMLDEEVLSAGIVRAFQCERALQLDCVQLMSSGQWSLLLNSESNSLSKGESLKLKLLAPVFKLDGADMLEHMSHCVHAVHASTLPAHRDDLKTRPTPRGWAGPTSNLDQLRSILSRILFPSVTRAVVLHYRHLAHRRMAAIALAIRLYEIDHGQRPHALAELVPDYLPAVPADPMSSNGVIEYLPDAEHPRLYSVGPDGTDDGGEYAYKRNGAINWDVADMPFFLDGILPPPDEEDREDLGL